MAVRLVDRRRRAAPAVNGNRRKPSSRATAPNSASQKAPVIQPNRIANRKRNRDSPRSGRQPAAPDQSLATAAAVAERVRNRKSQRRKARPPSGTALRAWSPPGRRATGFLPSARPPRPGPCGAGVQAMIAPAGMAAGRRGGHWQGQVAVRPDWNDEASESMKLENPAEIEPQSCRTLRRNNGSDGLACRRAQVGRRLFAFWPRRSIIPPGPPVAVLEFSMLCFNRRRLLLGLAASLAGFGGSARAFPRHLVSRPGGRPAAQIRPRPSFQL